MSGAYEGWAVVSFFGHTKLAGKISEVEQYGVTMLRLDIPDVDETPGFTVYKGGASIFDIVPTTKETAVAFVRGLRPEPVSAYELRQKALPPPLAATVEVGGRLVCVDCEEEICVCDEPDEQERQAQEALEAG